MSSFTLSVREAQLVVSGLTTLLRELERQEVSLIEARDRGDGSLATDAAPGCLDELGALETEIVLLQERLGDAAHLADVPDEDWPRALEDLRS